MRIIGFSLVFLVSSSAWALEPGNYAVQCESVDSMGGARELRIRMDYVDLRTLRESFGNIISGVDVVSGRNMVLLANEKNCSLREVARQPTR